MFTRGFVKLKFFNISLMSRIIRLSETNYINNPSNVSQKKVKFDEIRNSKQIIKVEQTHPIVEYKQTQLKYSSPQCDSRISKIFGINTQETLMTLTVSEIIGVKVGVDHTARFKLQPNGPEIELSYIV
jgi:hypothetical protein